MKNILVLGANGFLGSHFCKILNKRNYKIFPVVRYSSNLKRFRKLNKKGKITILKYKDISDTHRIIKFIKKYNINILINFAAHGVLFRKDAKDFKIFNKVNYLDVKNLIQNCLELKLEKYVHIGTISEFGKQKGKIYDGLKENAFDKYSLSKLNFTNFLKFHIIKVSFFHFIKIISYIWPIRNKKTFPYIIHNIKNLKVKLTSGKQIRNYTYVDDINLAIIKCIESKKILNKSLILGNEKSETLKNIVYKIVNTLKKKETYYGIILKEKTKILLCARFKKNKKVIEMETNYIS